ncbi:hydrogenase maturation protease [Candidatus Sumerlaeota bacterium]|nr:hydrogenase maturation protease [Candidatus Sumerlaeota bacterium]
MDHLSDRVAILGLGNTILSDDGLGILAAQALSRRLADEPVTVLDLCWGGFSLLDALEGFDWVIVLDVICTGQCPPGTIQQWIAPEFCPSQRIVSQHDMGFFTALEFGRRLGLRMPRRVSLFTVEALDIETVSETLTPAVEAALEPLVESVMDTLRRSGALRASRQLATLAGAGI